MIFLASVGLELVLLLLNRSELEKNANLIPPFAAQIFSPEEYQRSVNYSRAKLKMALVHHLFGALVLAGVVLSGFLGRVHDYLASFQLRSGLPFGGLPFGGLPFGGLTPGGIAFGVISILITLFLLSLLELPFSIYSTFVIEERFGFNKMTARLWIVDFIKGLLVSALVGALVLSALLWFIQASAGAWWIYASIFVVFVQLFFAFLYPVLIAPLFNKFTALPQGPLREALLKLSEKAGFKTSGLFTMDGSKRSAHANAYFTGFGRNKRIVLFDTLIEKLEPRETVAVLAHEIGHEKLGHIKKSIALSMLFTVAGFYILNRVLTWNEFYHTFGFSMPSAHAALTIFMVASAPCSYFLAPLFSTISRRFEFQADAFTVKLLGQGADLSAALCKLSKTSLSNLTPHRLYSAFHYSHPTLYERLNALKA